MKIKMMCLSDIPAWVLLSKEYDRYVQEIVSDLTEWYEGNESSLPFDKYMESKINKSEAQMVINENGDCCGAIAVSKASNNITFFAISHMLDFEQTGNLLLDCALSTLNSKANIKTNLIKSNAEHIQKQLALLNKYGFVYSHDDLENGVPVSCLEKRTV